ncbi:hypothetical protein ACI7YT_12240 [Microbacterium sp. M]|uniref:hypothetical protein n=1 Tax=Microbacterium sp. M TaxID=3377125 RepID=UPI00386C1288
MTTTRPANNLPDEAQAWRRSVEQDVDKLMRQVGISLVNGKAIASAQKSISGSLRDTGLTQEEQEQAIRDARRTPAAPDNPSVTTDAYFDEYGYPRAAVFASSDAVIRDTLGQAMQVARHELLGRKNVAGLEWTVLTETIGDFVEMTVSGLPAGEEWAFAIRAVSTAGVAGENSAQIVVTLAKDTTPPPQPSRPTASSRLGQIMVNWDGLTSGGATQPADFSHADVMMATSLSGTGYKVGTIDTGGDTFYAPEQEYGVTVWFYLVAVDFAGNRSIASERADATAQPLVDTDVSDEVMDSITAIVTANVEENIGGSIIWSTLAPTPADGAGRSAGATWYRHNTTNSIIGMWEWDGTAWQPRNIDAGAIAAGAVTDAKIATGAVLEAKIADAAIATAKLKDSAVSEQKIANLAVGTAKIADAAIVNAKIGNLAVSSAKIADAAIVEAKIGDAAITTAKIGNAQVTDAKIVNLNAGKINAGYIDAARIDAGTITATKLAVSDFSNYASGSDFEDIKLVPWSNYGPGLTFYPSSGRSHSGTTSMAISGALTGSSRLQVPIATAEGEQWYIELWASRSATWNGTNSNSKLRVGDQNGSLIAAVGYAASDTNSGWTKRTGTFTVPAGVTALQMLLGNDATDGLMWLDDIIIRRMNGGELIVDGAITALKIAANQVDTNHLQANAVTANKIEAGAITTVKLAAGAVEADKIKANSISADKITLGNSTNMVDDPSFLAPLGQAWSASTGGNSAWSATVTSTYGRGIQCNPTTSDHRLGNSPNANARTPVVPGEKYQISAEVFTELSAGTPIIWLYFLDRNGAYVAGGPAVSHTGSGWASITAEATVPASADTMYFMCRVSGASSSTTGRAIFCNPRILRKANAELIVDGAVTADKISATAIDGKTITGALVRSSASGARTELNSNGIQVVNSSNQVLTRLGYGIPTGLSIRNPYTGSLIELADAAFGAVSVAYSNNLAYGPSGGEGAFNGFTRHSSDDCVLSLTAVAPAYIIQFGQTWSLAADPGAVAIPYVGIRRNGSGINAGGARFTARFSGQLQGFSTESFHRVGQTMGQIRLTTTPGSNYNFDMDFNMWTTRTPAGTLSMTLSDRFITATPLFQ